MHVAFVQNALPPIIRAGAFMVLIGGGLSGCGRMGDLQPIPANDTRSDTATLSANPVSSKGYKPRLGVVESRGTDFLPTRNTLDSAVHQVSPELVD